MLTLALDGGYGAASSFLVAHDNLQLQLQAVHIGYAPAPTWEFVFGEVTRGTSDSAYYAGAATTWTQFQLSGAYHRAFGHGLYLGGALRLDLPGKSSGLGFAFAALGGEGQVRGSWRIHPQVEASVNVGYLVDRTERLIATPVSRMQRLALGSAQGSRAT